MRGRNFFPYKPIHLEASPPRPNLANIVNAVQRVPSSGEYQGERPETGGMGTEAI
jgi:L-asparaginase